MQGNYCLESLWKARSSRSQMFFNISVLKNFANFSGKYLETSVLISLKTGRLEWCRYYCGRVKQFLCQTHFLLFYCFLTCFFLCYILCLSITCEWPDFRRLSFYESTVSNWTVSANPMKWSNTLKHGVGNNPRTKAFACFLVRYKTWGFRLWKA